jgi:hypothetical protein
MLALTDDGKFKPQNGFGTAQGKNHKNCPQAKFKKKSQYQPNVQNRFSVFNSNVGKNL